MVSNPAAFFSAQTDECTRWRRQWDGVVAHRSSGTAPPWKHELTARREGLQLNSRCADAATACTKAWDTLAKSPSAADYPATLASP